MYGHGFSWGCCMRVIKLKVFDCPACGYECVHLGAPEVEGVIEAGGADYRIIVSFNCEEGCEGRIVYHHHEGYVTLHHEVDLIKGRSVCT